MNNHKESKAYPSVHHTDLNTFAIIVSILEQGHIYTPSGHRVAAKIIAMCQREQQTQLRAYDRATAGSL